ncbi:MAG: tetratricopeptide repeat protein [Myxococcota bacterium]
MKAAFLSRFTPSLLPPEALEEMFVQRSRLAETVVEGVRQSCLTSSKHYYLVTGPRGIGKTHFVSLVYHRLQQDESLRGRLRIAWLREEEWGVASYLDFLLVVLRALNEADAMPELAKQYDELREMEDPDRARPAAERLVVEAAGDGTLLIIAENLDEIFLGLEESGQRALRALIQNHPVFSILGTAQSLFGGVTSREQPFYGFFETHQLGELTFENAVELVARIAKHDGNAELARLLKTPRGRARMRAVHHLAAGNPRVYVIFSQFVTAASLDELVKPLLQTLDDLTPYYQSRMAHLSPQQRKIVEYLCEHRGAATVSRIAKSNFITSQTTSSQLRKLDELGYVRSTRHGRSSYYELREPLLRLTLEVKKLRGEPVRLIVEFLRLWYSERELTDRLGATRAPAGAGYLQAALELKRRDGEGPLLEACRTDLDRLVNSGDYQNARDVADELLVVGADIEDCERIIEMPGASDDQITQALFQKAGKFAELERLQEAIETYEVVIARSSDETTQPTLEGLAAALINQGIVLGRAGKLEAAIAVCDEVVKRFSEHSDLLLREAVGNALINKGVALGLGGEVGAATAAYDEVVERFSTHSEPGLQLAVARALFNKGSALALTGDIEAAVTTYEEVVGRFSEHPEPMIQANVAKALCNQGMALRQLGRLDAALAAYNEVADRFSDNPEPSLQEPIARALFNKGIALASSGDLDDAIAAYDEVVERFSNNPDLALQKPIASCLINKGVALRQAGRVDAAISTCDEVVTLFSTHSELPLQEQLAQALFNKAFTLTQAARPEEAMAAYEEIVDRFSARSDVSLQEHVAQALFNKGYTLGQTAELEKAISAYDEVVVRFSDRAELSLQEQVGKALVNKGLTLARMGEFEAALAAYEEVATRFSDSSELSLQECVARAVVNQCITLARTGQGEAAVAAADKVVARFSDRSELPLREQVANALVNKGAAFMEADQLDDALSSYDEILTRFSDCTASSLQRAVAIALFNKGVALGQLGELEAATAAYKEVVDRFSEDVALPLQEGVVDALFNQALWLGCTGRLDEGKKALADLAMGLESADGGPDWADYEVVRQLFLRTKDHEAWRARGKFLLEAFRTYDRVATLGVGLVESIRALNDESVTAESARVWLDVWTELAGGEQELQIPLRMLKAAVAYLKDDDEAALQGLPAEEREVVESLL